MSKKLITKLAARKINLPKPLVQSLIKSNIFKISKTTVVPNLKNIREAFNSDKTPFIAKTVILNKLFNPSVNYNNVLSFFDSGINLKVQLNKSKSGYYFSLTDRDRPFTVKNPLMINALTVNQLRDVPTKLFSKLNNITNPTAFNKSIKATLWLNNYLGHLAHIADFIRSYIRSNDPQKLWYEGDSPKKKSGDHIYRFENIQELNPSNRDLKHIVAREELQQHLEDLRKFDKFASKVGLYDEHEHLKSLLETGLQGFDSILNGILPPEENISPDTLAKIYENPQLTSEWDSFSQSLLNGTLKTIGDWTISYGDEDVLNVDFTDDKIIDEFINMHGNLVPPTTMSMIKRDVGVEVNPRSADDFRRLSEGWKKRFKK